MSQEITPPKLKRPMRGLSVNKDFRHNSHKLRLLIGTPMVGLVRSEWVAARYTQITPTNWGQVEMTQMMLSHIPLRYQVADAENIIVKQAIEGDYEWLLFIEHDNILPPGTFVRLNEYMVRKDVPMVSSVYFTKSDPPEPMVYRDFGHGYYADWKMGDKVWVKGCPLGCTLIHTSLLKVLWEESPEYVVNGITTRRVFHTPNDAWYNTLTGAWQTNTGTSDLNFCDRLVKENVFEKAGWPEYQKMEYPILIDTNIFVKHITQDGVQYPLAVPEIFLKQDENIHVNLDMKTDGTDVERKIKLHFKVNGLPAGEDGKAFYESKKEQILKAISDQLDAEYDRFEQEDLIVVDGTGEENGKT